jgi:hypothetical protein
VIAAVIRDLDDPSSGAGSRHDLSRLESALLPPSRLPTKGDISNPSDG